jgi:hypothetical protein
VKNVETRRIGTIGSVIEPGELFLSFMRGAELSDDQLPRFGIWPPDTAALPRPIDLNDAGRDWIAAIGLPAVFRRRGTTERTEDMIRTGMADRVEATGDELDRRMTRNAERHDRAAGAGARRSRGKENVIDASDAAGHPIERHLDTRGATQGNWALDGVRTDVDLLLAAVAEQRWADARRILEVVAAPAWKAPATAVEISGVEVPPGHVTDPTARRMLATAIARTAGRPPRGRRRPAAWLGAAVAAVAVLAIVLAVVGAFGGGSPALTAHARALRAHGRILTVSNLVTSGTHMTEDRDPAVLSGKPSPTCCAVKDTARRTGDHYDAAVCQTKGVYDTNGNDNSSLDDRDPDLAQSDLYYGVLLPDGRFGFTSDVWVVKSQRGGLGLPECDGDRPPA